MFVDIFKTIRPMGCRRDPIHIRIILKNEFISKAREDLFLLRKQLNPVKTFWFLAKRSPFWLQTVRSVKWLDAPNVEPLNNSKVLVIMDKVSFRI